MPALIQAFLDEASSTYTYVLHAADDGPCAIVDSVLTYDPGGGYGHPDHVQAHRVTMRAVELAGHVGIATPKVYWVRTPRSWANVQLACRPS